MVKSKTQAVGVLKTIIVKAPESLREYFGLLSTAEQGRQAARLRKRRDASEDASVLVLKSLAPRILAHVVEGGDAGLLSCRPITIQLGAATVMSWSRLSSRWVDFKWAEIKCPKTAVDTPDAEFQGHRCASAVSTVRCDRPLQIWSVFRPPKKFRASFLRRLYRQ